MGRFDEAPTVQREYLIDGRRGRRAQRHSSEIAAILTGRHGLRDRRRDLPLTEVVQHADVRRQTGVDRLLGRDILDVAPGAAIAWEGRSAREEDRTLGGDRERL